MTKQKNSQGSAIITAIGMGIVLMLVIFGLHTFTSYRIQTTIQVSRKTKALAIAEAGIEAALAELSYNNDFLTHQVSKQLEWQGKLDNQQFLKALSSHNFSVNSATRGTYSGSLGDGDFKVRVGEIPFKDDPATKHIDESTAYLLIESLGRYQETIKKVRVVINRRYPAREFLKYDGGFLSLIFGEPGKNNKNVFSTGHLYGHKGIEVSRILTSAHSPVAPGTDQELDDMNAILSGAGGIFFFSPIKAKFRDRPEAPGMTTVIPKNFTFPTHGTYDNPANKKYGEYPLEMKSSPPPEMPEHLGPWIKDKRAGVSIPPKPINFNFYRKEAKKVNKGMYFQAGFADSNYAKNYRVPNGWTGTANNSLKSILLDFGNNIRPGNVTLPTNFNGMIFAEDNVVIKGNPPKDVYIVTPNNVFVAGDFNQAGDPDSVSEFYGLPQDYEAGKNALNSNDYRPEVRNKLLDDASASGFRNHVAATVIADKRIVYDYRSPVDCFENELFPFMKYKLAKHLTADDTAARNNCLEHNHSGTLNAAATSEEEFTDAVEAFFDEYKLGSSAETSLKDELQAAYTDKDGNFSFEDFDKLSRKVWSEYAKAYDPEQNGELSLAARSMDYGVYSMLKDLRAMMNVPGDGNAPDFNPNTVQDNPGDYLYYPEMTTNGMFISNAARNNLFYAGPDYIKIYNEIGRSAKCVNSNVGLIHSRMQHMVHRIYGSEMQLRQNHQVQRLEGGFYSPPVRRRLYDESLAKLGNVNSKYEISGYIVLTWQDTIVSQDNFNNF